MKAIRIHAFGGPEVLKLEDIPDPKPAQGEVLITTKAIGVNPVDTYIRAGRYGDRPFPYVPGLDAAGVVETVGPGATRFKSGARVYIYGSLSGAYAEKVLCKESQVHALPEAISFAQGAALGVPYVTAHYALVQRGQAVEGETVFIHGASGGVGTAAVQIARNLGLHVIGTGGTPEGRELVRQQGAHEVLDHRSPGYLDELMKLTGNQGVPLILEMLANENLGKDLKVLASRGRVVVIGSRGEVSIDPRDAMSRNADIRGMTIMFLTPEELAQTNDGIASRLQKGYLKPVVGQEFPLHEAARAHERVVQQGARGKIVLVP